MEENMQTGMAADTTHRDSAPILEETAAEEVTTPVAEDRGAVEEGQDPASEEETPTE